jgi:4-hydroxybenzoate polyprenyltransferase
MLFGAVVGPANPVVVVNTSGDGIWFAVLGFVGVLVGAFASGGFNLLVARRRERRTRKSRPSATGWRSAARRG